MGCWDPLTVCVENFNSVESDIVSVAPRGVQHQPDITPKGVDLSQGKRKLGCHTVALLEAGCGSEEQGWEGEGGGVDLMGCDGMVWYAVRCYGYMMK